MSIGNDRYGQEALLIRDPAQLPEKVLVPQVHAIEHSDGDGSGPPQLDGVVAVEDLHPTKGKRRASKPSMFGEASRRPLPLCAMPCTPPASSVRKASDSGRSSPSATAPRWLPRT